MSSLFVHVQLHIMLCEYRICIMYKVGLSVTHIYLCEMFVKTHITWFAYIIIQGKEWLDYKG